ncbi:CYTH domain-containing protein [Candidatus Dojkabacteria bacterium]|uniref:CYTH domain-containing protein n=1 Tax=Candidatus Dojkabacteria bacterium TaxID=2099670 RepID=A0A955L5H7_9BACT|nr:CYTH domain-containing protein [Candidatus Dojkabacteria bacterium]
MALEIEVKILEIDPKSVKAKLIEIGAKEQFAGNIHVIYFVRPEERTSPDRSLLRIRQYEGQQIQMTYKQNIPDKDAKVQNEFEIEVNDFQKATELILALGFEILEEYTKYMATYELEDARIDIEKYDKIPHNAEIEGRSKEVIEKYVELLELEPEMVKPWSEKELFKHYGVPKP